MRRKKNLTVILSTSIIWLFIFAFLTYIFSMKADSIVFGSSLNVVVVTRDINVGEQITQKDIQIKKVSTKDAVNNLETNLQNIIGKRAIQKINRNQQITKDLLIDDILTFDSNSRFYTIPVNVASTSGNMVNPWDYVDIIISYKEASKPAEIVLSKRIVYDIRTSDGKSYQETGKSSPGYATFVLTLDEIKIVDDALKQGTLYLSKYFDTNAKESEATYIPSWK